MSSRRPSIGVGDVVGGRFRLLDEVGEGGMSRVYEAVDLKFDRPAAVKVLARWLAEDDEFRERFEREARAAERVTHPHVLPVWHVGAENGLLFLVTPLCDTDLGGLLKDEGPLEPSRALSIIARIAWALDWANGRGVVHRDVKPENILLLSSPGEDHAYLADFGLSKARVDATLTQAGHAAGLTPAYAAPEQWLSEAIGPAADQYALAGTIYTCLAGHPPFHPRRGSALREAHLGEPPPDLSQVVAGVPEGLAEAVARGLAKSPDERFGSSRELVAAAQAALQRERHGPSEGTHTETEVADVGSTLLSPDPDEPAAPAVSPPSTDAGRTPFEGVIGGAGPAVRADAPPDGQMVPPDPVREVASAPAPAPSAAVAVARSPAPAAVATRDPQEPRVATDEPAGRGGFRRRRRLAAALVLVLAAIGAVAAVVVLSSPGPEGGGPAGGSVQQIPVGPAPIDVAVGGGGSGGVWVANSGSDTVTRISPRTGVVRQKDIPAVQTPFGVAVGEGRTWVVGPSGDLAEIDPQSGRRLSRANLGIQADGIAAGFGALWTFNATAGTVTRVDLSSGRIGRQRTVRVGRGTSDIAVGPSGVWVTNDVSSTLVKLEPATGDVARRAEVGVRIAGVAVGEGAVWVTSPGEGKLLRIDPETWKTVEIVIGPAGREADVAVGDGAAFYVNHDDGTATRVDPVTNQRVGPPVRVATSPRAAVVAARALWVTDIDRDAVARLRFSSKEEP